MPTDLVDQLIELRRALPEPTGTAADLTKDGTGLALTIPNDELFWLEVVPTGDAWQVIEVQQSGSLLPTHRTVVATATDDDVAGAVDRQYRRLLIDRRNAACGKPTRRKSTQ
ncbi:MAG: hypothetical protein ACOYD0_13340 [Candidatus Nanopelagicales bacterium]